MDKEEDKITYTDTWYNVDSDTGKTTKIDQPRASRSSSPVDDFLENFLKNRVIAFGKTPEIIENVKEMQRKWLTYITEIHAWEGERIKKLIDSLPINDEQLIENHKIFFRENKPYQNNIGLLRAIGLNYLSELKDHLNQFKNQTGGRKKRKKSKHRKRRKSRTKRRKKKTKKRRKMKTKRRRTKRRKSRRKKRGSGSNFLNDILQEEKKIQKKYENPTPEDLFELIYNIENDTDNLTPEERTQFRNGVMAQETEVKKLIFLISTWQVFQKGRKNKIKFFQYNDFDDFMKIVRAHISEDRDSQSGGRR